MGLERRRRFVNLDEFFAWLERRNYRVHIRVMLARYRAYDPCPSCHGARLKPEALAVTVGRQDDAGDHFAEHRGAARWLGEHDWSARERDRAGSPARRARRAGRGAPPGRTRLSDPRPPGAHAVRRRDPAYPSGGGAGVGADVDPLRARRADHRSASSDSLRSCWSCCAIWRVEATPCWSSSTTGTFWCRAPTTSSTWARRRGSAAAEVVAEGTLEEVLERAMSR